MSALRGRLAALGLLAIAFWVFSAAVAAHRLHGLDLATAHAFATIWSPGLLGPLDAVAVLAGAEVTCLVALGLAVFEVRRRRRVEAWAVLAFLVGVGLELVYKRLVQHPSPPALLAHPDGPSLTQLFVHGALLANSYPSGHVVRSVIVYGLIAYFLYRRGHRVLAPAGALILVAAISVDRLLLEVHWLTDIVGGLLLGGICLLGAIIWIEGPRVGTGDQRFG